MDALRLPIDPRTVEKSLVSRKLRSVEQDGSLTFDDPDSSNNTLSDRLGRIWDEHPNGLLDISEARLEGLDPQAPAIAAKEEVEEEEEVQDRSEIMTYQDMQKLRSSLFDQLNTARNELWFALELAKTLGASSGYTIDPPPLPGHPFPKRSKPNPTSIPTTDSSVEPPVLPAGSYTATPASNPTKSQPTQILDMELALAAKHQALDECSALIDSAVEELEVMSDAGDRFWRDLRQLKSGQGGQGRWAVVPRPDFTRSMAEGEKAKDVVIPYALDEALRARCLAAFDLDPTKVDPLTFGARTHRRLQVSITTDTLTSSSTRVESKESSIWEMMDAAQSEAVDEELYNELYAEIARHTNGEVTPTMAKIKMGKRDIVFEMYDTRKSPINSPGISPMCDMIASAARLSMLHIHRRRKRRSVGQAVVGAMLLQPILQILQYQQTSEAVRSVLAMHARVIETAELRGSIDTLHSIADSEGSKSIERLLAGEAGLSNLSVVYTLGLEGCPGITVEVFVPASCRITTSCASFAIQEIDDLPSVIADDMSRQLLVYTERILRGELGEENIIRIYIDELENVIRIQSDSILEVSIPAPYDRISASVTGSMSARYDDLTKPSFPEWIRELATAVASPLPETR